MMDISEQQLDPEAVLRLLARRRSVREFQTKTVDRTIIDAIINDAREAPTSCNHQMTHVVAVSDVQTKEALVAIAGANKHIVQAPVVLVLCFQKGWNHNKFAVVQSAAIMGYHMCLSAHLRGLATVWNAGIGNQQKVGELLHIPNQFEIIGIICIGYEKEGTAKKKAARRPLAGIRSWDTFHRPAASIYPLKKAASYPYDAIRIDNNTFSIFSPDVWGWDRIADLRSVAVYSKSPIKGVYLSRRFEKEMDAEVAELMSQHTSGKLLEVMPYGGSYTTKILQALQEDSELHIAELSQNNIDFVEERVQQDGLHTERIQTAVFERGILPYADNFFDTVFLPQVYESIPRRHDFLKEIHRVLKPGGRVVCTIRNMFSWFGVYYLKRERRGQVKNFGPYIPRMPFFSKRAIAHIFHIESDFGFTLLPNLVGKKETGLAKQCSRLYCIVAKKIL